MKPVKRLRSASRAGVVVALLLAGCPFHEVGLVYPGEEGTVLDTEHGERVELSTAGEDAPLAWLDRHTTEVWGNRMSGKVHVTDWKIPEGLHGMPAWVGELELRGAQLGLQDRNSGAYYLVDHESFSTLTPYVGRMILIEGYIDGAHRVKVMFFRVLEQE